MMRSRRGLAAIGVFAAFAAGACWQLLGTTASPAASVRASAATAGVGTSVVEPGDAPDAVREELRPAPGPADETASPGTRLRIADADGRPLPGAEYFHGALPRGSQTGLLASEACRERWHPTDAWLGTCTKLRADAGGYVTSYTTDVPYLYVARDHDRLAFWGWPFRDELQFVSERTCTVRVVDPTGAPIAGAAVVLRNGRRSSDEPILGITDGNGTCVVRHLERLASEEWRSGEGHRLGVRGLGLRHADVAVDAQEIPERLTLTLPPCGTIAVELVDSHGNRLATPEPVRLFVDDTEEKEEELTEYVRASHLIGFGHCAVGQPFVVGGKRGRRCAGPAGAGDRVVVRLSLTDLEPGGFVFTGRALASDGRPLASCALRPIDEYSHPGREFTTTGDGRFLFARPADAARKLAEFLGIVQCEWREHCGLVEIRGVPVQLPDPLVPGHIELGDVRLQDSVLRVRGQVRGDGPVAEFDIRGDYYSDGLDIRRHAAGRFEIHALPHRKQASLDVHAPGYAVQQVTTPLPGPDLDIALAACGSCEVIATLAAGTDDHREWLRIDFVDAAGRRWRRDGYTAGAEWHCSTSLPPGSYHCEARIITEDSPIATVGPLVVVAGKDTAPLRVDLSGHLRTCQLSWVDAAGEPVELSFEYVYCPRLVDTVAGRPAWDVARGNGTGCTVLGTGGTIDVVVESESFTGRYTGPLTDARVLMQPVPTIPFHIPDLPAAPPSTEWTIRAVSCGGQAETRMRFRSHLSLRPNAFTFGDVDADGRGRIALLPNSSYAIELLLCPSDESTRRFRALDAAQEVAIGASLPARLVFQFDRREVDAAIR